MEILPGWWTEIIRRQETPGGFHLLWNQVEEMPIINDGDQWLKNVEVKRHVLHWGCWGERHARNRHTTF